MEIIAFLGGIVFTGLLYFIYTQVKKSQDKKLGRTPGGQSRDNILKN